MYVEHVVWTETDRLSLMKFSIEKVQKMEKKKFILLEFFSYIADQERTHTAVDTYP